MVIDSSALVAIVLLEDSWQILSSKIQSGTSIIAAPTLLEAHMVLRSRLGKEVEPLLEVVLQKLTIEVAAFGLEHYKEASSAFDRFGKGRHPASLNFGDCISYALSKVSGQPLLFIGNDFSQTDLARA